MECRTCAHSRVTGVTPNYKFSGVTPNYKFYCSIHQKDLTIKAFNKMSLMEKSDMSQNCKQYSTREDILIDRIETKAW